MIRGILQVIVVLFVLRIFFWFLRLISAGMREADSEDRARRASSGGASRARANAPARRAIRVDRSDVTDVPFTEIPDERPSIEADRAPRAGTVPPGPEPVERAEAR